MSSDTEREAGDIPAGLTSSPSHLGVGENVNAEDIPAGAVEDQSLEDVEVSSNDDPADTVIDTVEIAQIATLALNMLGGDGGLATPAAEWDHTQLTKLICLFESTLSGNQHDYDVETEAVKAFQQNEQGTVLEEQALANSMLGNPYASEAHRSELSSSASYCQRNEEQRNKMGYHHLDTVMPFPGRFALISVNELERLRLKAELQENVKNHCGALNKPSHPLSQISHHSLIKIDYMIIQ